MRLHQARLLLMTGDDVASIAHRVGYDRAPGSPNTAPDVSPAELERMVEDCLRRRLFSIDEARARLDEPDMRSRPGALLLRRLLGL